MSDTDGILTLTTGTVSDVDSVSMDLFVEHQLGNPDITVSFVGTTTTVLLTTDTTSTLTSQHTRVWTSVSGAVSGTGYLVVEFSERRNGIHLLGQHNVLLGWTGPRLG